MLLVSLVRLVSYVNSSTTTKNRGVGCICLSVDGTPRQANIKVKEPPVFGLWICGALPSRDRLHDLESLAFSTNLKPTRGVQATSRQILGDPSGCLAPWLVILEGEARRLLFTESSVFSSLDRAEGCCCIRAHTSKFLRRQQILHLKCHGRVMLDFSKPRIAGTPVLGQPSGRCRTACDVHKYHPNQALTTPRVSSHHDTVDLRMCKEYEGMTPRLPPPPTHSTNPDGS